jgi:mRNA interferase RelE/StbE
LANYRVFETDGFQKDLRKFARTSFERIRMKLVTYIYPQLRDEPHFGLNIKHLRDWDPPTCRYHVRAWRFFYEIDELEKIIYMTVGDHRGSAFIFKFRKSL